MRYHVKWQGYEAKKDRTWETEENLEYSILVFASTDDSLTSDVGAHANSSKATGTS